VSGGAGTWPRSADLALLDVLVEAQELGFLGPGAVSAHLAHSRSFVALMVEPIALAVDLGSGGGVPGLVLALAVPASTWVLLDANERRTRFLERAVTGLGLAGRVEVRRQRAEVAGRDRTLRGQADVVVARSFGPPAVTAECAAPLLRSGGALIVAEPPGGDPDRWPSAGLAVLGLRRDLTRSKPWALQRLIQASICPDRFPRRSGVPAKRPLFVPLAGDEPRPRFT
jgi:16S rRNA (guanine527-N7)-methyltransferase